MLPRRRVFYFGPKIPPIRAWFKEWLQVDVLQSYLTASGDMSLLLEVYFGNMLSSVLCTQFTVPRDMILRQAVAVRG